MNNDDGVTCIICFENYKWGLYIRTRTSMMNRLFDRVYRLVG